MWMLLVLGLCLPAFGDDWPQFRGPTGQGYSAERNLPVEWSESQNVRWKVPIAGRGWSSPVVQGNRIWLTTATDPDGVLAAVANLIARSRSLRAIALDTESGRIIHNIEVFRLADAGSMHSKNSHASPTPIIEGDRVYVHFGAHGTAALSTDGKILWKAQLPYNHVHGTGGSPVLHGDLLIFNCDGADVQYVVALDKRTGQIRWKAPRKAAMAFATPLVIKVGDAHQVVSPGAFRAIAYEPASGKEIWSVAYGEGFSNVPRPVFANGMVYICSGFYQPYLMAVRPDGNGDVTSSHVSWIERRSVPLTPSPLAVKDEIYLVSDNGIASCLDGKTGKVHWRERLGGNYSASPVFVDGRIYFSSEDGETVVVEAGTSFRKLAVNKVDGSTLASLAVSNGAFFLRTATDLYRIENPPPAKQ